MDYRISADTSMCKGQDKEGLHKCDYRTGFLRYMAKPNERQVWSEFWKSGDDCPHYLSLPRD